MNNIKLKNKFILVFLIGVIIPLICTNGFLFYMMKSNMDQEKIKTIENISDRIESSIFSDINNLMTIADYMYMDKELNRFLTKKYASDVDYYDAYVNLMKNEVIHYYYSAQSVYRITICTENETITNGNYFVKKSSVEKAEWYREFIKSGRQISLYSYFEDGKKSAGYIEKGRHVCIIRKMNYYDGNDIMLLDLNYNKLLRNICAEADMADVYVYDEEKILFNSQEQNGKEKNFLKLDKIEKKEFVREISMNSYGAEWNILLTGNRITMKEIVKRYNYLLLVLFMLNMIFPCYYIYCVYRSLNDRIKLTQEYLKRVQNGEYEMIPYDHGKDEIGEMMKSYNMMADKIKELVEVIFKNREKEQNLELSKKEAELKALQSQINPHFMFNALESIRMHSVLKNEIETARILENFAILMRKNIQWNKDLVTIEEECDNVKRYLEIQKYRFGKRLEFSVHVQQECLVHEIPKFIIITFVENACVHGIENSVEGGLITVIVSEDEDHLYFEIMDSGSGMTQEELEKLLDRIENASIQDIQNAKRSIGILNTVIRMKQYYNNQVKIEINSAIQEGTEICICIPKEMSEKTGNSSAIRCQTDESCSHE